MTCLEDLPNELFLCIFGRLSFIDIYYSFSNLNKRLSDLIVCFLGRKTFAIDGYLTRSQVTFAIRDILPLINENQLRTLEIRHDDLFRDFIYLTGFYPSFVVILSLVSLNNIAFDNVYSLLIRCPRVESVIIDVQADGTDTNWLDGSLWDETVDSYCLQLKSFRVEVRRICRNPSISTTDIKNSFRSSTWNQRKWIITCRDRENSRHLIIRVTQRPIFFLQSGPMNINFNDQS